MTETTSHMIAAAQACLDGEDFGMSTADLVEDMMHELLRLQRDNFNLEHHYRHHREAGERLHTQYHEIREALQEAVDVWASHLNCMPNVHSRKRLDVIRDRFCDEPEESVAPKTEDEIAF